MRRTKFFISFALIFSFLVLFTVKDVRAGDVEFYITDTFFGDSVSKYCWICTGPAFRSTGLHRFTTPLQRTHFYTASDGLGDPYGDWKCWFNDANTVGDELACLGPRAGFTYAFEFSIAKNTIAVDFVETGPGYDVRPTTTRAVATGDVSAEAVAPEEVQTAALGDDAREDKPDSDTFIFDAVEGDAIVLRLVGDPAKGYLGSQARLRLRRVGTGSGEEVVEGSVPLRLETSISESGAYEVVVEQNNNQKDEWYRGDYFLVLRPNIAELVPAEDVEH
ncbi:MAG: hypothetical protein ACREOP_07185 [Thermodesulfobacteriota bacterium]